jgi:predicted nucleotide-binding protein (sugar kinase/HSP70/actin superfamily)
MQTFDQADRKTKPIKLPIFNAEVASESDFRLPIVDARGGELDIEAELKRFEEEEMARLGIAPQGRNQWTDTMLKGEFTAKQRAHTTILVSGLTVAHDYFIEGALNGIGYNVTLIDAPTNDGLRIGKEFGNRGQCNPTYFTVGNLVKYLIDLRDRDGLSAEHIIKNYLFLTAGACGPCRFGMYVTEYRKALRDAGFEGFRVMLFQQTGGLKQATGEEQGLKLNPEFFVSLIKAILTGDVINALAYRIRPYELEKGATDRAMAQSKQIIHTALREKRSLILAILQTKRIFSEVKIDRLNPKPKVSIIGEFWAMTTEGDGNYGLQRFLEEEGAEDDIQLVAAWILYTIWESKHDTDTRMLLRGADSSKKGLAGKNVHSHRVLIRAADKAVRIVFHSFAKLIGLYDYHLPDMDVIAEKAKDLYSNELRGGEGHMEVGKLILNTEAKKVNMTLSVKPFGCMPSSGVSDGVQSVVTERYPETIYCAVETSGDGATNFYSRVQMFLFKARLQARAELQAALTETGLTEEEIRAFLAKNPKFASSLFKPRHSYKAGSTSANFVYHIAPYIKQSWLARTKSDAVNIADAAKALFVQAKAKTPEAVAVSKQLYREIKENWPEIKQMATTYATNLANKIALSVKERATATVSRVASNDNKQAAYAEAAE